MQILKLDINPKGEVPVLYASQYDKGRAFRIDLVDGDQAYNVPSGYSVQLNVRKTDSKLVTAAPIDIVDNKISFATTEQMTACPGENIASVTLKDADDIVITTLYFLISVQRDVLAGGLDSASEIHNLEEQIAAIIPEVIGDDYYNKTQTDALLANKANISDLAPLASKAELTQAILDEDTALKNWVSSNFATPGYVNERIFNMLPVGSASGNPCIFNTEIAAALQALTAKIVCGGGNGSPDSPIPIVGHSELNLTRCGVNLWNEQYEVGQYNPSNGQPMSASNAIRNKDYILIPAGTSIALLFPSGISGRIFFFDSNKTMVSTEGIGSGITVKTMPSGCCYLRFHTSTSYGETYHNDIAILYPSSETQYAPFNGQTFTVAFGQTVYGGVYDKSGRLTITHKVVDLETLSFTYVTTWFQTTDITDIKYVSVNTEIADCKAEQFTMRMASGMSSSTAGQSAVDTSNVKFNTGSITDRPKGLFCYELATPIVIDVPSISVYAENGTNNIISDCGGDVNVSYKDTIQHYIDQRLQ